ncbi:MAG: hypothetical protein IT285_13190 [Bdellovibrionales bacterium]|nr:hypothetical protein [Bdellovibrionales bacterium]
MASRFRECGIPVIFFAPKAWGLGSFPYSMHEKMLIIDGERAVFGGMSFGSVYRVAARALGVLWNALFPDSKHPNGFRPLNGTASRPSAACPTRTWSASFSRP